jgi:hypothetical protein
MSLDETNSANRTIVEKLLGHLHFANPARIWDCSMTTDLNERLWDGMLGLLWREVRVSCFSQNPLTCATLVTLAALKCYVALFLKWPLAVPRLLDLYDSIP